MHRNEVRFAFVRHAHSVALVLLNFVVAHNTVITIVIYCALYQRSVYYHAH